MAVTNKCVSMTFLPCAVRGKRFSYSYDEHSERGAGLEIFLNPSLVLARFQRTDGKTAGCRTWTDEHAPPPPNPGQYFRAFFLRVIAACDAGPRTHRAGEFLEVRDCGKSPPCENFRGKILGAGSRPCRQGEFQPQLSLVCVCAAWRGATLHPKICLFPVVFFYGLVIDGTSCKIKALVALAPGVSTAVPSATVDDQPSYVSKALQHTTLGCNSINGGQRCTPPLPRRSNLPPPVPRHLHIDQRI